MSLCRALLNLGAWTAMLGRLLGVMIGLTPLIAEAAWPDKQVTVIVPYAAGGNTDIMARILADELQRKFGQPFIVENRPGAGGALGAQHVARSPADGYTLLFGTTAQLSILPFIQKINYDQLKDFAPIAVFGQSFSRQESGLISKYTKEYYGSKNREFVDQVEVRVQRHREKSSL